MKKEIPKKGYRLLAVIWTLAAAAVAVALVRRLPNLNLLLLALLILSTITAASFWRAYHRTPERSGADPFDAPPRFADDPELFDDIPPVGGQLFADSEPPLTPNQDSEENDNER